MNNMKVVKVIFKDSKYNYMTNINGSEEKVRDYFVDAWLNMGVFPNEDMQQCIDIEMMDD